MSEFDIISASISHDLIGDSSILTINIKNAEDEIETYTRTSDAPYYDDLIDAIERNSLAEFDDEIDETTEEILSLLGLSTEKDSIADEVREALDGFISVLDSDTETTFTMGEDDRLYANGTLMPTAIARHVASIVRNGDIADETNFGDLKAVLKFVEKTLGALTTDTQEQLFSWLLANNGFTLTADGDILGYKSVERTEGGQLVSIHSGPGSIKARDPFTGQIKVHNYSNAHLPNNPGTVVFMDRELVQHDPSVGCAPGLHVGTWNYAANQFVGDAMVLVKVNPAHVISVPYECEAQKMRVSSYEVIKEVPREDRVTERTFDVDFDSLIEDLDDDYFDLDDDF